MRQRSSLVFVWVAACVVLAWAGPPTAWANDQAPALSRADQAEPAAALEAAGQTLTFAPKVADGLRLTVSGPLGVYSKREFALGETPTFVLIDERGVLPDGQYKYELRSQPLVDQRLLRIAEETDDDRLREALEREEKARTVVQSGQFAVAGGSIVLAPYEAEQRHEHSSETHTHE